MKVNQVSIIGWGHCRELIEYNRIGKVEDMDVDAWPYARNGRIFVG